jgi:hypothetical protein
MPTPPFPANTLSRPAVRTLILIGDTAGNRPTALTDTVDWLKLIEYHHEPGHKSLETMKLQIDLSRLPGRLQDVGIPTDSNRIVEARDARDPTILIGWGKLGQVGLNLGGNTETATVSTSIPWYLLGGVLERVPYRDGVSTSTDLVHEDLVFNPEHRKALHGNQSTVQDSNGAFLFAHRDSLQTGPAQTAQSQTASNWTIAAAVHRLLWTLNENETHLTNPSLTQLQTWLHREERDSMLINHRVKQGSNLPDSLDRLLKPLGYTWYLKSSGAVGSVTTELRILEYNVGPSRDLLAQRIGQQLHNRQTNVSQVAVQYDIDSNPNVYLGISAREVREVTVELRPGWEDSEDETSWTDIHKETAYKADQPKRHIGHKWVLNEAGDYNGFRPEFTAADQLSGLPAQLVRRRQFLPCLTRELESGAPIGSNGFDLRWFDSAGNELVFEGGFSVLENELGVWLDEIPFDLWSAFLVAKSQSLDYVLKLTATIELDQGIRHEATRRAASPNGANIPLLLDLSHRFTQSIVQDAGSLKSRFYDDRHIGLTSVTAGSAGAAQLIPASDPTDFLKPGQRVVVLDDPLFEGIYTATSVSSSAITISEPITTGGAATGTLSLNTSAEDCTQRLEDYVVTAQEDADYARISVSGSLFGVDHPQYELGDLITGVQPRNWSFNGRAGNTPRLPQVLGITYRFDPKQETILKLEQQPHE